MIRGLRLISAAVLMLPVGCTYHYAQLQAKRASDVALIVEGQQKDAELVARGRNAPFDSPTIYVTSSGEQVWASRDRDGLKIKRAETKSSRLRDGELLLAADGRSAPSQSLAVANDIALPPGSDVVQHSAAVPAGEFLIRYPYEVETSMDISTGQLSTGSIQLSLRVRKENVAGVWEISRPNRGFGWICFAVGLFVTGLGAGLTASNEGTRGIPLIALGSGPMFLGAYMALEPETRTLLFPQPAAAAPEP